MCSINYPIISPVCLFPPNNVSQYEYSMPVHPPPLPPGQTPVLPQQPGMHDQNPFQFINLDPTKQVQLQQHNAQPPFQQAFQFPLPEGSQPTVQQQLPPSDKQKQKVSFVHTLQINPKFSYFELSEHQMFS